MTRWVTLDGAVNVRDLGGLPTDDGGLTVSGAVLRSDNLQDLSEADVTRLTGELGVRRVVDLRTPGEVTGAGPGPLVRAGVEHLSYSLFPEAGVATDVEADDVLPWQSAGRAGDYPDTPATGYYLGYLRDRPESVTAGVAALVGHGGASIVHCAAGKDRTGVVVALAELVAGVTREGVVADYVATAERIEAIIGRLRRSPVYAADLEGRDPASHVPRALAMERFLDALDREHGGASAFLARYGFGRQGQGALRARLRGEA